jgi:hypothetical protein
MVRNLEVTSTELSKIIEVPFDRTSRYGCRSTLTLSRRLEVRKRTSRKLEVKRTSRKLEVRKRTSRKLVIKRTSRKLEVKRTSRKLEVKRTSRKLEVTWSEQEITLFSVPRE